MTCIRPCPPESTTPASFNTGSISGVLLSVSCPARMILRMNSSMVSGPSARLTASSSMPRATVRIVPSAGFMTAL